MTTLSSCKKEDNWNAEAFFDQTFKLIEDYSIRKNEINWIELKNVVKDSIKKIETNIDAYNAIDYTINLIKDGHSVFVAPQNTDSSITNRLLIETLQVPKIKTFIIDDKIGYISLPGFVANDSLTKIYGYEIRKALLNLDTNKYLTGWIVDLRDNTGGKLGVEPLGLMPLFTQSLIGISINNNGSFKKPNL